MLSEVAPDHVYFEWLTRIPQSINTWRLLLSIIAVSSFALQCTAVAAGSACPAVEQSALGASKLLAAGNKAFEQGDLVTAETRWTDIRECARATADWPKAVFNLGLLEYRRNDYRRAITYFDEVLQSHPNDKEPGASLMETNRNYSYRSALGISQCYEAMGAYGSALRYARLAKTKYPYYSWCGTCYNSANVALNKRIVYLTIRASRAHLWVSLVVLVGVVVVGRRKLGRSKRRSDHSSSIADGNAV